MNPNCDLHLENSEQIFLHDIWLGCCIIILSLVKKKSSLVQKISSGQTFIDILNLHCDLDHEPSNSFFFHRTLWLVMQYYQSKLG